MAKRMEGKRQEDPEVAGPEPKEGQAAPVSLFMCFTRSQAVSGPPSTETSTQ